MHLTKAARYYRGEESRPAQQRDHGFPQALGDWFPLPMRDTTSSCYFVARCDVTQHIRQIETADHSARSVPKTTSVDVTTANLFIRPQVVAYQVIGR